MKEVVLDTTVLIPRDSREVIPATKLRSKTHLIIPFRIHNARFLWTQLHPFLLDSDKSTFQRFVQIVRDCFFKIQINEKNDFFIVHPMKRQRESIQHEQSATPVQRQTNVTFRRLRPTKGQGTPFYLLFWIFPNHDVVYDNGFGARLNKLERSLIRAQSVAGYYATMGGGFYMCHHWKTALALAEKQKMLAALLGDKEMYYKCGLNQAYNYIFAGYFSAAKEMIKQVYFSAGQDPILDQVIPNMCKSAWLFCRRVKNAKLRREDSTSGTFDNYARIRIVDDRSSRRDLLRTHELLE